MANRDINKLLLLLLLLLLLQSKAVGL